MGGDLVAFARRLNRDSSMIEIFETATSGSAAPILYLACTRTYKCVAYLRD